MNSFKVAEHFISINGEGPLAGQLSLFIRFKGCNLNCDYCDTKWANQADTPFTLMTEDEIISMIHDSGIFNVTFTGGEPMLQPGFRSLLERLSCDLTVHVEIETNGSIPIGGFNFGSNPPSFTMDYKLSCSGMEEQMCLDNFALLEPKDTVKFVTGSLKDCERALEIIRKYDLEKRCHVYLSPVFGSIEPAQIVDFMISRNLNHVNLQIQMHKVIWDPEMRGV